MIGLGTVINVGAIVIGGAVGLLAGHHLTERFQKLLMVALALSDIAMSLSGIMSKMLVISGDKITTQGTYTILFSLILGAFFGELINLDSRMESFGTWLKKKTGNAKDTAFVDAFVTASFTVCIGAMAVMGSIMDGINGDYSILLMKSALDFFIILVMASSMGKGCLFSAIPVALFQGTITLFAGFIAPAMNELAMDNLAMVGSCLILCIGINLMADGRFRIKVANLLPAIVFAVIAAYIPFLG